MNVAYSEEFNLYADHFAFFERDYNSRSNEVLKEKPCLGRIEFRFFILCTPAETERQSRRNRETGGHCALNRVLRGHFLRIKMLQ